MAEVYLGVGIDASGAKQGANEFNNATNKIASGADKAAAAKAKFNQQLQYAKLALIAFATVAANQVVRTISDYTFSMSSAAAVTKATAAEIKQLEQITREMGATTMFSASQAADGVKFLGMAGFTTVQILEALPATLDLASAAALDMGRAADITSNIMSGFGLAASDAGRAADVLAAIASSANTDVSGMGQAMKFVGPIAKSLGITMEETAAAVGVLANAGIQGGLAGRGLRTSIASLLKPSKDAQKALAEMGLTVAQINPQASSLRDVIKTLANAGLDAEKAFRIFGTQGATAMIELTSSVDMLDKMAHVTNNAAGSAKRMADIMRDNLKGDTALLTSALSELALMLGEMGVTGAMRAALKIGTEFINWLSNSLKVAKENETAFALLTASVEMLSFAVAGLVAVKAYAWLSAFATAMTASTAATAAFTATLYGIPFVWVAGALSALGFSIYKVATNWNYVGEVAHETIMAMTNLIKRFAVGVFVEFGAMANFMVNRLEWVKEFAVTASKQAFYSATQQTKKFTDEQERFAKYTKDAWADAWMQEGEREQMINSILGVKNGPEYSKSGAALFKFFRDGFLSGDIQSIGDPIINALKAVIPSFSGKTIIPAISGGSGVGGASESAKEAVTPLELQSKAFWGVTEAASSTNDELLKYYEHNQKILDSVSASYNAEVLRSGLMAEFGGNVEKVNLEMAIQAEQNKLDIYDYERKAAAIREQMTATYDLKKATDAATEAKKKQERAETEWAQSMTYAFKDAIMNSKNLGDALSNLANRLQNMLVNKALDSLLGGFFGGFAKGAAFSGGGVTAFASGGIVNSPTMFPMSNRRTGLMGEAGPEAIMPLTRTSGGELGVKAVGGGGSMVIAPQINITVQGGSKEQNDDAAGKVSAAVKKALDDTVMTVILRERRPGGALT